MRFNKFYYGRNNPSLKRIIAINTVWFVLFFTSAGLWSHFIPSLEWRNIGLKITVFLTFFVSLFFYWLLYKKRNCKYNESKTYKNYIPIIIFTPLFCYIVIWAVVVHGIPSVITYTTGSEIEKSIHVGKRMGSIHRCIFRLGGYDLEPSFPGYLCISKYSYDNYRDNFNLHTKGKETAFGYYITWY